MVKKGKLALHPILRTVANLLAFSLLVLLQQKIAFQDYEQTVLTSYLEVLDRINAYASLEEQLSLKDNEVLVQRRSVDNANTMFTVGYANYLEVINSQRMALAAELEYVELKTEQLQNVVMLYKSLGGGWM